MKKALFTLLLLSIFSISFCSKNHNEMSIPVAIPKGASPLEISQILYENEITNGKNRFYYYSRIKGFSHNLRAGTFLLNPSYSYKKIGRILQEKEGAASLSSITVPEGFNIEEIGNTLEKAKVISSSEAFKDYVMEKGKLEFQDEFPFLQEVPTLNIEGYLFPDTYTFAEGSSHKVILYTFLKEFEKQVLPVWKKNPHPKGLHYILSLASIVEKEAQVKREMPLISGVFHNRLKRGIRLGACPTVSYAMGYPRKKMISFEDIKIESPYNTYKYAGLPPTPIASAGISAIKATLEPASTDYLYFVANGDGTHSFTKTYKAHLKRQREILNKK